MKKQAPNFRDYFKDLDSQIKNISKIEPEKYSYRAQDVLIQSHWELPIIVQTANSVVTYEFASSPGDLSFGVMFVAAMEEGQHEQDLEVETIEELVRTTSGTELIDGSFVAPLEGVLFFLWDNTFDWTANKYLSYSISVEQPSFDAMEEDRIKKAKPMLDDVIADIETASIRLADAEDYIVYHGNDVLRLEEQVRLIKDEIESKRIMLKDAEETACSSLAEINLYFDRISGVGIRCLSRHLLSYVIAYLPLRGPVSLVCKYWLDITRSSLLHLTTVAEKTSQVSRATKVGKSTPANKTELCSVQTRGGPRKRDQYSLTGSSNISVSLLHAVAGDDSVFQKPLRSPSGSKSRLVREVSLAEKNSKSSLSTLEALALAPAAARVHARNLESSEQGKQPKEGKSNHTRKSDFTTSRRKTSPHRLPKWTEPGNSPQLASVSVKQLPVAEDDDFDDVIVTGDMEMGLIKEAKKVRSEQQLSVLIDYIQAGYARLESLEYEKRRLKKIIRSWNASFERLHGRPPTTKERKMNMKEQYVEYEQVSTSWKTRKEKMDRFLASVNLTQMEFIRLRDRRAAEWKFSAEVSGIDKSKYEGLVSSQLRSQNIVN